jgi:hypothetical protein
MEMQDYTLNNNGISVKLILKFENNSNKDNIDEGKLQCGPG